MRFGLLSAAMAVCAAASVLQPAPAAAADGLPDLVIRSVELKATGKCNPFQPLVTGTLVIKNVSDVRAPIVVGSPLFSVYDVENPSFFDDDARPLESLAPGETATARVRIGIMRDKGGISGVRKFVAVADPDDRIEESDERNNSYFVRVPVDCP
jgi:hypothetical protein